MSMTMTSTISLSPSPRAFPVLQRTNSSPPAATTATRPPMPRRSSSAVLRASIARLRPLPLQYIWCAWHTKAVTSPTTLDTYPVTLLAPDVRDIGCFYRIFNNVPWSNIRNKDAIHFFRAGIKPLWEDEGNAGGGCWVLKVRKDDGRAEKVWEEVCVLGLGGALQAAVTEERDHVLGMSYSPRSYWAHISIWTKQGNNRRSIELLQQAMLGALSETLRPTTSLREEYYYKRHQDHEGWTEAMGR